MAGQQALVGWSLKLTHRLRCCFDIPACKCSHTASHSGRPQEPQHPLLRFERPPPEQLEDGSRPRIQNEANRQAQIAHLQRELGQAKAGEVVDRCEWLLSA